jgi:hypothetical protein
LNLGVTEEELGLLNAFLNKNAEYIKSPEDFLSGLEGALNFIALGYPELMDPTPADSLMIQLSPLQRQIATAFEEATTTPTMDDVRKIVSDHLVEMMGAAPEGLLEELMGFTMDAGSLDEFWNQFRRGYNQIAMREMNLANGGIDG